MLINLLPEFLEILSSPHREAAYRRYLDAHRAVLSAYWNNYVLDLGSPHADEVIGHALAASKEPAVANRTIKLTTESCKVKVERFFIAPPPPQIR